MTFHILALHFVATCKNSAFAKFAKCFSITYFHLPQNLCMVLSQYT